MFNFGFKRRNNTLPRKYLLFYSRTPNNWLDVGWETDFGWDSDLSAWSIPRTVTDWTGTERDVFTIIGEGLWFDAAGNSLVVSGAQLLADSRTNIDGGFVYAGAKGLAVYSAAQTGSSLAKLSRYFRFEIDSSVLSGWADESGSLWTDTAGSTWNV